MPKRSPSSKRALAPPFAQTPPAASFARIERRARLISDRCSAGLIRSSMTCPTLRPGRTRVPHGSPIHTLLAGRGSAQRGPRLARRTVSTTGSRYLLRPCRPKRCSCPSFWASKCAASNAEPAALRFETERSYAAAGAVLTAIYDEGRVRSHRPAILRGAYNVLKICDQ